MCFAADRAAPATVLSMRKVTHHGSRLNLTFLKILNALYASWTTKNWILRSAAGNWFVQNATYWWKIQPYLRPLNVPAHFVVMKRWTSCTIRTKPRRKKFVLLFRLIMDVMLRRYPLRFHRIQHAAKQMVMKQQVAMEPIAALAGTRALPLC